MRHRRRRFTMSTPREASLRRKYRLARLASSTLSSNRRSSKIRQADPYEWRLTPKAGRRYRCGLRQIRRNGGVNLRRWLKAKGARGRHPVPTDDQSVILAHSQTRIETLRSPLAGSHKIATVPCKELTHRVNWPKGRGLSSTRLRAPCRHRPRARAGSCARDPARPDQSSCAARPSHPAQTRPSATGAGSLQVARCSNPAPR